MEVRVNLALLVALLVSAASLSASQPAAALDPADPATVHLASLEDQFALDPTDPSVARELAESYLEMGRPGLAIAAIRAGDASLHDQPMVAHRLAQAYEATGRVLDAYATARFARNRCARSLGTGEAPPEADAPEIHCRARELAVLDVHMRALGTMVQQGVRDPSTDRRAHDAYRSALRLTHVAVVD